MIWLYAVTDRPEARAPRVRGMEEAPLGTIRAEGLAAVVSLHPQTSMPPTEENVLRHEAVLEALMADRAVLPFRFGAVAADRRRVRQGLSERRAWCAAALGRLRGRVELGLRVLWMPLEGTDPAAVRPAAASGREYLLARAEEERGEQARQDEARHLAHRIHGPLECLAAEGSYRLLVTPHMLLAGAYLVERERVPDFRLQVRALGSAYPALSLLCTGPWPPFNFVSTDLPGITEEAICSARC